MLTNLDAELSKFSFFVVRHKSLSFEVKFEVTEDKVIGR